MNLSLDGVRVLELARYQAGPNRHWVELTPAPA